MFREVLHERGWILRRDETNKTPTHFLLDGGRLAVPDDHAGTFLNVYFNSIIKKEHISLVELKTSVFKLFIDIDARVTLGVMPNFDTFFVALQAQAMEFFEQMHDTRMIVCAAEPKADQGDGSEKYGFHAIFPGIFVNAPIAMAFRGHLLDTLNAEFPGLLRNTWEDAIDDSVYKANGLRALYSHKGTMESRPYLPYCVLDKGSRYNVEPNIPASEKRVYVHDCSIRAFDATLTKCRGGHDDIADQPFVHAPNGVVLGKCVPLSVYADALPKVQAVLPEIYSTQRFTGVFVTRHAVMLRSSSRYCHNVAREHRTSTVYFCITKRAAGVFQKCYCRKDDHGCAAYSGPIHPLEYETLKCFFPEDYEQDEAEVLEATQPITTLPSKKRGTLSVLLKRSRFLTDGSKKKKKRKD